jgi:hypothetical protein
MPIPNYSVTVVASIYYIGTKNYGSFSMEMIPYIDELNGVHTDCHLSNIIIPGLANFL